TVRRWCKSPLLPQRSRETTGSGRRRPQSPLFVRGRKRPTPGHPALRPPRPILCCISSAFPPFFLGLFYQTGWGGFNPSLLLQSPYKGGRYPCVTEAGGGSPPGKRTRKCGKSSSGSGFLHPSRTIQERKKSHVPIPTSKAAIGNSCGEH